MLTATQARPLRRLTAILVLATLGTTAWGTADAPAATRGDEFFVVDCLLPPQVRKLGKSMTFLGPKRVIKTTGSDCEIRGGEYIAADRASHGASLKIWQEQAQAGDMEAANKVGEIFENGFQDYNAAAQWYRRAAEGGSKRAQMNLGMLYEQGRGVPQDPQEALRWYRKGSGLSDLIVDQEAVAAARAESAAEISDLRREIQNLRGELDAARSRLGNLRSQLNQKSSKAASARDEIQRLNQLVKSKKAQGGSNASIDTQAEISKLRYELKQAEQKLNAREASLAKTSSELTVLRKLLRKKENEAAAERAKLDKMRKTTSNSSKSVTDLQAKVAASEQEIEELRAQLHTEVTASSQNQAVAQKSQEEVMSLWIEVMTMRSQIAMFQDQDFASGEIASLETAIRERENALADRDQEVAGLKQQIASLNQESTNLEYQITRIEDQGGGLPPIDIEIIEPKLAAVRGLPGIKLRSAVSTITVIGKVVTNKPLLSVTINDRDVPVNANKVFKATVPVQGEQTTVQVTAIDEGGARSETSFQVIGAGASSTQVASKAPKGAIEIDPKKVKFGRYHALVIGNNKFQHLPNLETAETDAKVVARLLQDRYRFQVKLLLNASRYDILSALNSLRETLTENDNLLIYYAGHGELDRKNSRGYWLPTDAERASTANWISATALTDILNVMSARQIMIASDSCYSGALSRSVLARLEAGRSPEAQRTWLQTMASKRSRTVLTSGGLAPVSDGGGGKHSIFARAFIDVLSQNTLVLSGQQLFQEVSTRVTYAMADIGFEQVPSYSPLMHAGHELGDFFFVPSI